MVTEKESKNEVDFHEGDYNVDDSNDPNESNENSIELDDFEGIKREE